MYEVTIHRMYGTRYRFFLCMFLLMMSCMPKISGPEKQARSQSKINSASRSDELSVQKQIAVLELRGIGIAGPVRNVLTDELRKGVLERANRHTGFVNMTRESILSILNDNGIDPQCVDNSCEITLGREIGSDYIVTGEIVQMESIYFISIKLYETKKGNVLSMESTKIKSIEAGFDVLQKMGSSLIKKGLTQETASSQIEKTNVQTSSALQVRLSLNQRNYGDRTCYNDDYHLKVMTRNIPSLETCLKTAQNKRRALIQGTMDLKYAIDYEGVPKGVRISDSTFAEREFELCVILFVRSMKDYRRKGTCQDQVTFTVSTSK